VFYTSVGCCPPGWLAHQQMEHLTGDEPFEAPEDVLVAEPFCLAAFSVGLGLLMPAQPHGRVPSCGVKPEARLP